MLFLCGLFGRLSAVGLYGVWMYERYAPTVVTFYWQASVDTSSRYREFEELQYVQFAPFTGL